MTALRRPVWTVGLSYHGNRMIHSRIENVEIQNF